jgi:predicted dehydrogenase
MSRINRRQFLEHSRRSTLGFAAGTTILPSARSVRAAPANERLVLAMIGVGSWGNALAMGFLDRDDCQIGYVCDVNRQLHEPRAEAYAARQGGKRPKCVQDFRQMLQDNSVDAAVVATPQHWHALATILCCRAGKDVYCEKPQSLNGWEGRQAVAAARKYDRIVQIGTHNRSAPYNQAAKRYLEEGKLGRVHLCRVFEQCHEANFSWGPDSEPPDTLDWDLWLGPAPARQYNRAIPAQWRHLWDYSGGNMAYQGIHQIDLARWLCGVDYPSSLVVSLMGRPDRIVSYPRQTRTDVGVPMCDNGLIVFEYPRTTATIRTASLEVDGHRRRQLVVCGDRGTVDIQPLETITVRPAQPQSLRLALSEARDPYSQGYQEVSFPLQAGRYDDQLIELAEIIRGERENPYPLEHELLVQQCLLEACGYPLS